MHDGSGGRIEVPFPLHVDFSKKIAGWENHLIATQMKTESPSSHGEVNSYSKDEFIPLLTINGEGPDKGKKVVVYLELQKVVGPLKER